MPDLGEIRIYDQTRPKRVKYGAAACAALILYGILVDGFAMHFLPELLLDSFWIGRPEQQLPWGFLLSLGGLGACIVPYCMYYGAVRENKCCLCVGGMCTWMFCALTTAALLPTASLVGAIPAFEEGLDKTQAYYADCDPKWCCDVAVTQLHPGVFQAAACDTETGLPFQEYEEAYLDCLLGADPDYVRSLQVNPRNVYLASDPAEAFTCKWSLLYLTECEGRLDEEFFVYTNNWAYDMKEALNGSLQAENLTLIPPILVGPEDNQSAWKRIPVPPGWEPGDPLMPGTLNMTASRRVDAEETVEEEIAHDAKGDVKKNEEAWAKFGDDLEKFNWTKLATNPKNPGPFKFKHLFKSDLDKCVYRPEALEDAHRAAEEYVPNLKVAVSVYIMAIFIFVLCGIGISSYACAVTFHFCCFGKKEPDYMGV